MAEPFKLQPVLNYRRSLEDQAQQKLAESLQQQRDLEERIGAQHSELADCDAELKRRQQQGLDVAELRLYEDRIAYSRGQIRQLQKQLEILQRRIGQERASLLEAARERQIMEKLKDKQDSAFRREQERKERVLLDEISLRNRGERS